MIETREDETEYGSVITIVVTPNYNRPATIVVETIYSWGPTKWRYNAKLHKHERVRPERHFHKLWVNGRVRSNHRKEEVALRRAMNLARRYEKAYEIDRSRGRFPKNELEHQL